MSETKELIVKIRKIKEELDRMIELKGNLQDYDIIKLSKELDELLNEYDKIKRQV
ncbi:MAG TPA: Spo0E family sporulation regulatory protein-aspartic acid phosphatase [Clostridiales bacterium]|nr:Spo0E family sporulation regulatory protein-aspartic acid phosphatase [Clostridiales bacterium]